ncbi:hypothetical protein PENTCL1PPCAC_8767 [Pristionchus entomophagus]|uniref:DUF5648 domain-containing protein n=1 Tax=Pristionchus entomophagus TaxID=358040 RepID=A0AAV5STC6_9BILA|nr:hypothetical protein PENTCL1PPCAC_8767 [Pristionchus entomophagus]
MRLVTLFISSLLVIAANCHDNFNVELYPQSNFQGEAYSVEDNACVDIPDSVTTTGNSSLRANRKCVIIFSVMTRHPPPAPPVCDYSGLLAPLLRAWNAGGADHFYTTNADEHARAVEHLGYANEGQVGFLGMEAADPLCTSLRPLFRLYRSGSANHFYTANDAERANAERLGYSFESIEGYCVAEPACGATLPLFRFYSSSHSDHFYTTSVTEMEHVRDHNPAYSLERIECYLWQSAQACH